MALEEDFRHGARRIDEAGSGTFHLGDRSNGGDRHIQRRCGALIVFRRELLGHPFPLAESDVAAGAELGILVTSAVVSNSIASRLLIGLSIRHALSVSETATPT
ncbi:hypothetical protein D3C76_924230 [compost metagenome]